MISTHIAVQVFHGADSDVVWLQQDFNVYVVNLFDTFHASKLLGNSLFLLSPFCTLTS
jgi:ribonuclease D